MREENIYTRVLTQTPSSCTSDCCTTVTRLPGAGLLRERGFTLAQGFSLSWKGSHRVGYGGWDRSFHDGQSVWQTVLITEDQKTGVTTEEGSPSRDLVPQEDSTSSRLHCLPGQHHQLGNKHVNQKPVGGIPGSGYGVQAILSVHCKNNHLAMMPWEGWVSLGLLIIE